MGIGRPREFDAETALDQAMEVFWRHGYEGATIAQLTEAMGINPPSLYACFGNKEGLLKAALDRYTKLRGVWMDEVVAAPTARDVAERMLMGIADKQTDPANPPGCLLVQGGIACGIPDHLSKSVALRSAMYLLHFQHDTQNLTSQLHEEWNGDLT